MYFCIVATKKSGIRQTFRADNLTFFQWSHIGKPFLVCNNNMHEKNVFLADSITPPRNFVNMGREIFSFSSHSRPSFLWGFCRLVCVSELMPETCLRSVLGKFISRGLQNFLRFSNRYRVNKLYIYLNVSYKSLVSFFLYFGIKFLFK